MNSRSTVPERELLSRGASSTTGERYTICALSAITLGH